MQNQNENDDMMIAKFIREKKKDACRVIDAIMSEIGNPDRIASAPLNQLSSVMGTLIDKFGSGEKDDSAEGTLASIFKDFEDVS